MKLESQVVSLSLAKKLKELGVKQESYFYWIYTDGVLPDGSRDKVVAGHTLGDSHWELGGEHDTYAAFTTSELGEMLPSELKGGWLLQMAPAFKGIEAWVLWYEDSESPEKMMLNGNHWTISANTEADARATMLIYLLENNLLPAPERSVD